MSELEDELQLDDFSGQQKVPNNVGILVLGICSIFPGCICYGVPGIVCGIISLTLASKANKLIQENANRFTPESIQLVKAGRICAIIGICTSSLFLIFIIAYFVIVGSIFASIASAGM